MAVEKKVSRKKERKKQRMKLGSKDKGGIEE